MASAADIHPNFSYSEDDDPGNEPESSRQPNVKRGTRACDRCRKIKSKCEAGSGADDRCKNCEIANTACTFQGPSFKRGPPKGYIHSIEQRWHQVECILATIMESPRAQDLVNDLRGDSFANAILNRVQAGPYGARSRLNPRDATNESFYSSLIEVPEHTPARDDRRSRRQSRVSREIVSQDPTASATPTREWQDQLARRIAQGNQWAYTSSPMSPSPSSSSAGGSGDYARTRRRLDWSLNAPMQQQQNWDGLYTLPDAAQTEMEQADVEETAEAFGHLAVDHNREFRYHGPASGLPLLAQSHRTAGDDQQQNRIWQFTSNVDPESSAHDMIREEEDVEINMPSMDVRNHLLQLYFTYVHPFFPVIHKADFLQNLSLLSQSESPTTPTRPTISRHPMQRPCKILLCAMFAIAARYSTEPEDYQTHDDGSVTRAGQQYAEDAHKLLDRKYQSSRPSTCQALLLLAIREFGMGAMDKGWLYSGMALRMAIDLGMNRNADGWTTDGKQPIFSETEKQIRKHIWWACCVSDKLSAVWLGRPITFRANDYSIPMPDIHEPDENEPWQPFPPGILGEYRPQPSRLMSCFRQMCHLSVIITDIMDKIYSVQHSQDTSRRVLFEQLESRLNKWLIQLPEHLHFAAGDKHANVLPHVLMLHIEYHAAVLLLHRAFLPAYDDSRSRLQSNVHNDPLTLKAFDTCSGAAVQICSMAEMYNERFGLERAPAFLCIYLQSAGIMHVITLTRRPLDPQATLGLSRCISACRQLEKLWPTATRLRHLLEGAKVRLDESIYSINPGDRRKRTVEDALGSSKNSDIETHEMYSMQFMNGYREASPSTHMAWDHAHNSRMVAQTLGVDHPSAEASTSFYPGYQWWPSQLTTTEGLTHMALSAPMDLPPVSAPMAYDAMQGYAPHAPHTTTAQHGTHTQHTHTTHAQEPFAFGQQGHHMAQDFVPNVSYQAPSFDFSRYDQGHSRHDPGPSRRQ